MIDKTGPYWHLYFSETCDDEPTQVLALADKLFAEIAELGPKRYVRVAPTISRNRCFATDRQLVNLCCRISSDPP